jgi:hypothetical protein
VVGKAMHSVMDRAKKLPSDLLATVALVGAGCQGTVVDGEPPGVGASVAPADPGQPPPARPGVGAAATPAPGTPPAVGTPSAPTAPGATADSYAFGGGSPRRFNGAVELSKILAETADAHRCYARHLFEFLSARPPSAADDAAIELLGRGSHGGDSTTGLGLRLVAGRAGGFLKTGQFFDAPGAINNKLLNVLLSAMGLRKPNGDPIDDFGDPGLAKGLLTQLVA